VGLPGIVAQREGLTFIVREVPAQVRTNCGKDYVDDAVARDILNISEQIDPIVS
jgi:hypothetical protein